MALFGKKGGTASAGAGIKPEIIAAIGASINMMMDDAEMVAAISAAVIHASGSGVMAVPIQHQSSSWAVSGRMKIMDGRQKLYK